MKDYRFIKEEGKWYIDLPAYLEHGGNKADLQMVEGADTMLDIISREEDVVSLTLHRAPFPGSDVLQLMEKCDPSVGGGYYRLQRFEGTSFNQIMWLCAVTEYVFGDLPELIFIKRV